ncbi:PAS domain-containing sensor histidine kinase [Paenibacillus flagellatus]|uniref:PAS domain-containing sensor histidine kinase n=1 Tax=Paenibacillus flagellatus TaxID=2211139 RepID=UPI00268D13CC
MSNERGRLRPGNGAEGIGHDVDAILPQLDDNVADPAFREWLKQSLEQLADLKFALNESTIVAVTDRRGAITYVNDRFCDISQYAREELIGQDHRIINSGYHDKAFMRELWRTIAAGRVWRGEIRNRAKDGSYYWVHTTIVPFLDEAGKPYQYLAVRNEVTQLKRAEEEIKTMMARVMEIQEEERRRFSRELHDGIGQSLFSLLIGMDGLIADAAAESADEAAGTEGADGRERTYVSRLERLRRDVSGLIEDVRGLAWELRPSVLDDLGVVPAVRTHIAGFSRHYGVRVAFDCNLRRRLDVQKETAIYRVIQEALANVGKYAETAEATVTLTEADDAVVAVIADRGRGFDPDGRKGEGVGLFSMEERARGVGGSLTVESSPGAGTVVTLVVPKDRETV